jgi:Family of unknown function (DUF6869)
MYKSVPINKLLVEWAEWAENPDGDSPGHSEFLWIVENEPEKGWTAILTALKDKRLEPSLGIIAAGPLEDLLSFHGEKFIERVEKEARSNPTFAHLLGGVWQSNIRDDVWKRVQLVWDRSGWDENA